MEESATVMWYYAENNQQKGPVDPQAFLDLVRQGIVTSDTLVWRSGLPTWQPYGAVVAGAPADDAQRPCHYCGKPYPKNELIDFNGTSVCAACKPIFVQQFKEDAELSPALARRYAGFWIRVLATILDNILCGILVQVLTLPLLFGVTGARNSAANLSVMGVTYLISFTIGFLYYVMPMAKYGATPGKMACGLKVIRSDGAALTYGRAIGRYFGNILSGMILWIGYLMAAFDKQEHKALHDILCDTRVIYKNAKI